MVDSHCMQMMDRFFLHYMFMTTGGLGVKAILQTIKDWLWITAGTLSARFHRRLGQWNIFFTELHAPNLQVRLARRNSHYCFCGMKSLDANQLWHQDEDRGASILDQTFSVSLELMMNDRVIGHLQTAVVFTLYLLWLSQFITDKIWEIITFSHGTGMTLLPALRNSYRWKHIDTVYLFNHRFYWFGDDLWL